MREFSKELIDKDDRRFEIGGEVFKWRYPYWEDFAERRDQDAAIVANPESVEGTTFKDLYQDFISRIEPFLDTENDALARWKSLTKRKTDPVPAYQFSDLYSWLLEVTSARPTETPSSSLNGRGSTEATSTEDSSLPVTTPA